MSADMIILLIHSWLRWVVLLTGILLGLRSFTAWRSQRNWQSADERLHRLFVATVDTQFTLGLLLYVFFSPLPWLFCENFGSALQDPILHFFRMEHVVVRAVAATIVHVGRVQSRRAPTDVLRHHRVWITTLIVMMIIMVDIPWPGLPHGRPLFRAGSQAATCLVHYGASALPI